LVCYYGTWAIYRPGRGKFEVNHIDPNLCTHLVYSFFGIGEDGSFKVLDPYLDLEENYGKGNIKKFNKLKTVNPGLKTLAAIGGWNEGSRKYSAVARDPAKRKRFAQEARKFLQKHGFDGLDIDWEYPAQRDGNPQEDKQNYIRFLSDIKKE
jgi:chitinase